MAGEWKTIEQREMSQRRARKTKRHGLAVAGIGAATAESAHLAGRNQGDRGLLGRGNRTWQQARRIHEPLSRRGATWAVHRRGGSTTLGTLSRKEAVQLAARRVPRNPLGATFIGGTALVAAGAAHYAQGRAREGYQQSRINSRRRSNAAKPITKGLFPLRRAAKAGPVIREGITRAGRVGVSYEHKGTTAWGLNASAARANWEVSRVSQAPAARVSRPQPRFGSGGSGGRRIIEKADTSGRKPTIARTGGKTPVGGAQKQQPRPSVVDGPVIARGKVTGIVPMATGQQMTTGQQEQTGTGFGKADRYYDPEDRRQRRIGATAAAAAGGGGALGYSGGKEIATTGSLARLKDPNVRLSRLTPVEGPLLRGRKRRHQLAGLHPNQVQPEELAALRGVHVTPRAAGKVGAGVALLGVAGRLARRGDDPRKRRWN